METIMPSKPQFVILGGAGKIAKYHFEAIEKVGGEVVGVIDHALKTDMLGIPSKYVNIDEFEATALHKLQEYYIILSPNHLHVEHSAWALKYGDVICEKPLAINISELSYLKSQESLGQTKVHPIMQMRRHPDLENLHKQFQERPPKEIDIDYVLPRGKDYDDSWQGDTSKSGGIVFSIAIHLLDFLTWTLGEHQGLHIGFNHEKCILGSIRFSTTSVYFKFSTMSDSSPQRTLKFDGNNIDLTTHFSLHNLAYQDILEGHPLSISDIEPTIKLCEEIRNYK